MKVYRVAEVVLYFFGEENIPAIGSFYEKKEDAVRAVNEYMENIEKIGLHSAQGKCSVKFARQYDGRYSFVLMNGDRSLETLKNLDELMLRRFRKGLRKNFFVVTSFCLDNSGEIECLAITEGLGAVLFAVN